MTVFKPIEPTDPFALYEDLTIDSDIETVVFDDLDRGIWNMATFIQYIKRRFPKLKDLWINQNFIVCYEDEEPTGDPKDVYDLYHELNLRSLVLLVSQCGVQGYSRFRCEDVCDGGLVLIGEGLDSDMGPTDAFVCSKISTPYPEWFLCCLLRTLRTWRKDVCMLITNFAGQKLTLDC